MHQKGSPRAHWEDCLQLFFVCKNQGGNSKDEKVISLKPFQERLTDIVGYRGVISNQKGCPKVNRIKGKLYTRNQGPDSRDKKVICLLSNFETDGHCGL